MNKLLIFMNLFCVILGTIFFSTKETSGNCFHGSVIFIDPGHGGNDNGASFDNVLEDEINLKISHILYEMIINEGGICHLTRVSDYDLSDMYSKNHKLDDLKRRVRMIDSLNASLFISLHLNSYSSSKVEGIQVFYQKHNENSKILADILQNNLNDKNKKNKTNKIGDYYLLNNTKTTGVIIEYGFLSNENDRKKLTKESYLKELAFIIKDSINEYLIN